MASRRAIREELLYFLSADSSGTPANLPDPPPPYEDGSNRLFELLSRACHLPLATQKLTEDSHTVYELLPLLLLRIFGYRPGSGWLETASDLPHYDREALLRLVLPNGPIHNFCRQHEQTYEFPVSNLPNVTWTALSSPSYSNSTTLNSQSALAHLLRGAQRESNNSVLYLTPLQYFELCMVSSAAKKWTDAPRVSSKSRRQRRSSSLPSVRALYNKVIAAYAELLSVNTRLESTQSLLIPACIDMFCLPWVDVIYAGGSPRPSTPSVDALSSVLLMLVPKSDSEAFEIAKPKSTGTWTELTHGEALYKGVEILLGAVFARYNSKDLCSPFAAYVRLFALYLSPWKRSIRLTMHAGLYPKKRGNNGSGGMRTIQSTLNSINEQLKYASGVSPQRTELVSSEIKKKWREGLYGHRKQTNCVLVLLCTIRSANQRLASAADGCRALGLVGEAITAAELQYKETQSTNGEESDGDEKVGVRMEEARGCLVALKEQIREAETRSGVKSKPFVTIMANCLGIRLENTSSLFSVSRVAEKLTGVATSSVKKLGTETSRLVQRRRSTMLRQSLHERVEFEGSVWEQPITGSENEHLILAAYWLSLQLEPYLGFELNLRWLGRPSSWLIIAVALLFFVSCSMLIRAMF